MLQISGDQLIVMGMAGFWMGASLLTLSGLAMHLIIELFEERARVKA